MKKMFFALLLPLIIWGLWASPALAAGTVTQSCVNNVNWARECTFTWVGDASDGSVPAFTSTEAFNAYVILAEVSTGATQPTALYSVSLTVGLDADTIDIMGGQLGGLSQAGAEQRVPKIGSVYGGRLVVGSPVLRITGNSVASATGSIKFYMVK